MTQSEAQKKQRQNTIKKSRMIQNIKQLCLKKGNNIIKKIKRS